MLPVRIEIIAPDDLALAFGQAGTYVGPRLGANARTQEQKEWWCLRRYIFTLCAAGQIVFPISIVKGERPDFRCEFGPRSIGIEVTEATDPTDQRESSTSRMRLFCRARSGDGSLMVLVGMRLNGRGKMTF